MARALPQAVQVADRWHLMENASRAFLDAVRKSMRQIRGAIGATVINPALLTAAEKLQYDGYLRREETNASVLALWQEGVPIKQIVRRTGHHRQTVRRIVASAATSSDLARVLWERIYPGWMRNGTPAPAMHPPSGAQCEGTASGEASGLSPNGQLAAGALRKRTQAASLASHRPGPSRG